MRTHPVHRIALVALCAISAGSCEDAMAPPAVSGPFALGGVDGQPLPITLVDTPERIVELIADTLELRPNQRYRRLRALRQTDLSSGETVDYGNRWTTGTLEENGGSWTMLNDQCSGESLSICIPPDTLLSIGSTMMVRSLNPNGLLLYEMVTG